MAITNTNVVLWDLPILVVFSDKTPQEREAIDHYNQKLGCKFFVEKGSQTGPHMAIDGGAPSKCSIGCRVKGKGDAKQTVGYNLQGKEEKGKDTPFKLLHTILHEVAHGLGLEHEQFHPAIPFDVPKPKNAYRPHQIEDVKDPFTKALWEELDKANKTFMDSMIRRREAQNIRHLNSLPDWDSIMLYGDFRRAFFVLQQSAERPDFPDLQVSENAPAVAALSKGDVQGLRMLYGAALNDMEVTYES